MGFLDTRWIRRITETIGVDNPNFANLNAPLADIKSRLADVLPRNITQIAGTTLSGRDWSLDFAKLQSLDISLSAHRDAITSQIGALNPRNITHIGGVPQTGRDWSGDLSKLPILVGSRSSTIIGASTEASGSSTTSENVVRWTSRFVTGIGGKRVRVYTLVSGGCSSFYRSGASPNSQSPQIVTSYALFYDPTGTLIALLSPPLTTPVEIANVDRIGIAVGTVQGYEASTANPVYYFFSLWVLLEYEVIG